MLPASLCFFLPVFRCFVLSASTASCFRILASQFISCFTLFLTSCLLQPGSHLVFSATIASDFTFLDASGFPLPLLFGIRFPPYLHREKRSGLPWLDTSCPATCPQRLIFLFVHMCSFSYFFFRWGGFMCNHFLLLVSDFFPRFQGFFFQCPVNHHSAFVNYLTKYVKNNKIKRTKK